MIRSDAGKDSVAIAIEYLADSRIAIRHQNTSQGVIDVLVPNASRGIRLRSSSERRPHKMTYFAATDDWTWASIAPNEVLIVELPLVTSWSCDEGDIEVRYSCRWKAVDGILRISSATAKVFVSETFSALPIDVPECDFTRLEILDLNSGVTSRIVSARHDERVSAEFGTDD